MNRKIILLLLVFVLIIALLGCAMDAQPNLEGPNVVDEPSNVAETPKIYETTNEDKDESQGSEDIGEFGEYTTTEEVALYIHIFGELPSNFITKKEAMDLGWESNKGNLWDVTAYKSIGGDRFGNREGLLPKTDGRIYYECDVNYEGGFRDTERIVFSNDGLIFYTNDHYESFEQLY